MTATESGKPSPGKQQFATTHWSMVLAAGRSTPQGRSALETLCRKYWFPLYVFVRRQGHAAEQAEDLTQGFFTRLLEKGDLRQVDPERGRFRSFVMASIRHFIINEWDKAQAEKRGGGRRPLSIDFSEAEERYRLAPADDR